MTEDEDTHQLPPQLAERISASLNELDRVAQEAVPERGTPRTKRFVVSLVRSISGELRSVSASVKGLGLRRMRPSRSEESLESPPEGGGGNEHSVVGFVVDGQSRAITRTAQGDDSRFHLDVSLSLEGLDEYEAHNIERVLTHQLRSLVSAARQENSDARITQLLRAMAPPDPLADVELKVAADTVDLRREFFERMPVLTSAQLHERVGFPGNNPSQTGLRWRKQGKLFSINHGGRELYPAFQLGSDGRPLPIVAELLEILGRDPDRTEWDNALWFADESGWLDGKTPIELMLFEPDLVKRAAEQEILRDES